MGRNYALRMSRNLELLVTDGNGINRWKLRNSMSSSKTSKLIVIIKYDKRCLDSPSNTSRINLLVP